MKQLSILFFVVVALQSRAQKVVKLSEVRRHIGDTVIVCGKVFTGVFVSTTESTPTFLNLGAPYPNQLLTVVIWPDVRDSMKGRPEEDTYGKRVCVAGEVESYKGKPQITIKDPKQLYVVHDTAVPTEQKRHRKKQRP